MALTDTFVRQVKHKGAAAGEKYADGGGMYLLVKNAGRYWRMDYRHLGKRKTLALGTYPEVSLAKARSRRDAARVQLADGADPSTAKRQEKLARAQSAANTFQSVAVEWLSKTSSKRAPNTQSRVEAWLQKDVYPYIGNVPTDEITARDVLEKVIRRLEARGAIDSAHRVKQLCGQVFRFAVVTGRANSDPTSDLKEALETKKTKHHAAITEPGKLGELLRAIHGYQGTPWTVIALKLAPMLLVRPGELRKAEWAEIDLKAAEWRIPGSKMKMGIDHVVPLSKQAVQLLLELKPMTEHARFLFPSIRTPERCMSENTLNAALRGMGWSSDVHTTHGFRATARTLLDEILGERVDLIEHQLAHAVRDANGRAYNRTAHLPARRLMMQRWSDYLDQLRIGAAVLSFRSVG
jgi:integrase